MRAKNSSAKVRISSVLMSPSRHKAGECRFLRPIDPLWSDPDTERELPSLYEWSLA